MHGLFSHEQIFNGINNQGNTNYIANEIPPHTLRMAELYNNKFEGGCEVTVSKLLVKIKMLHPLWKILFTLLEKLNLLCDKVIYS